MKLAGKWLIAAISLGFALAASAGPLPGVEGGSASDSAASFSGAREGRAARNAPAVVLEALARVNGLRRVAGLEPVVLDESLSRGCQQHARYLLVNRGHPSTRGLGGHEETSGLPGYTDEGRRAAAQSCIAFRTSLLGAVDTWMATLYHRIPILRPTLKRIGMGYESGIAVMDVVSGVDGEEERPIAFPADGQSEVPLLFPNEIPDPIPAGASHPAGYPITLQFPTWGPEVAGVRAELTDGSGRRVTFHLSHPESPACGFPQQNTVCLIPAQPLAPATTYRVTVAASYDGKELRRSWSFRTEGGSVASQRPGGSGEPVAGPHLQRRGR
jgi:hypothetical protein